MATLFELSPVLQERLLNLAALLTARQAQLFTAESCTGGLLAATLTAMPGASTWFGGGFIPYSNALKIKLLAVKERTLKVFGAVSEATVAEMALGLLTNAKDWGVAVSGIAGPDGGTTEKPVGMVCFALASHRQVFTFTQYFSGDRAAVREASVYFVLEQLEKMLTSQN